VTAFNMMWLLILQEKYAAAADASLLIAMHAAD
jgi:hypothetical protein